MLYKGKHIGNNCSGYIINIKEAKELNQDFNPSRFDNYHEDYRIVRFNDDCVDKLPIDRKKKLNEIGNTDWVHRSQIYHMSKMKEDGFDIPFVLSLSGQKLVVDVDKNGTGKSNDYVKAEIFITDDFINHLGPIDFWKKSDGAEKEDYVFLKFLDDKEKKYFKFPFNQIITKQDLSGWIYNDFEGIDIGDKIKIKSGSNKGKLGTVAEIKNDEYNIVIKSESADIKKTSENISNLELLYKKPELLNDSNVLILDPRYHFYKGKIIEIKNNFVPPNLLPWSNSKEWCLIEIISDYQFKYLDTVVWIDKKYVIQPNVFETESFKGTQTDYQIQSKKNRFEIYEDNDIDKLLVPDQLNENPEIESLDKVLFHIQKEITLNGDYKIHLFLDNIDIEGNKKIIKYGECSVSKDVYNYLNSPIVEFVLSVNNFGATQFQPLRITENNKTSRASDEIL